MEFAARKSIYSKAAREGTTINTATYVLSGRHWVSETTGSHIIASGCFQNANADQSILT